MWFHASNQIASRSAMSSLPSFHLQLIQQPPEFLPFLQHKMATKSRLASLLILLLSAIPSVTFSFLYLLKARPAFNIWLMSPPLHKVLLNNQNIHSFIHLNHSVITYLTLRTRHCCEYWERKGNKTDKVALHRKNRG